MQNRIRRNIIILILTIVVFGVHAIIQWHRIDPYKLAKANFKYKRIEIDWIAQWVETQNYPTPYVLKIEQKKNKVIVKPADSENVALRNSSMERFISEFIEDSAVDSIIVTDYSVEYAIKLEKSDGFAYRLVCIRHAPEIESDTINPENSGAIDIYNGQELNRISGNHTCTVTHFGDFYWIVKNKYILSIREEK